MLLIVLLMTTSLVFALFKIDNEFSPNLGSGEIKLNFTGPETISDTIFNYPGDIYTAKYTVKNEGTVKEGCAFKYNLEFAITKNSIDGIENAVFFYFDGKFLGSLSDIFVDGKYTVETDNALFMGETRVHTIVLEYHIGAGIYYKNTNFNLKVKCIANQLTEKNSDIIFVKNYYEFCQALKLNYGPQATNSSEVTANPKFHYEFNTIKLIGNITLDAPVYIDKLVNIDLNGYSINLNGQSLNYVFQEEGIYYLKKWC